MLLKNKTKRSIQEIISNYKLMRRKALSDLGWQENKYKEKVSTLRKKIFSNFEKNLEIAKNNLKENGFNVYEADNVEKTLNRLKNLLKDSERIVKTKTNTGREIGLENFLKGIAGNQSFETDLGDFIVELFNSEDMHYVLPALHINPKEISAKIKEIWDDEIRADEEALVHYL